MGGLVDAGQADEDAAPVVLLVVHDLEHGVGGPDVAALVPGLVADDVAVVGRRVELGRELQRVVDLVALDPVAGAARRAEKYAGACGLARSASGSARRRRSGRCAKVMTEVLGDPGPLRP